MQVLAADRRMVFILCCVSLWSTARIANADEEKASNTVMLWPKDEAGQVTEGMGTPKPDRGDGHIRLTDITTPSMRYFPAPGKKDPVPAVILCPGGGYVSLVTTKMTPIAEWLNGHGISAFMLIYRAPKKVKMPFRIFSELSRLSAREHQGGTSTPSELAYWGLRRADTLRPGSVQVLKLKPIRKSMSLTELAANQTSRSCFTQLI